MRWSEDEGRGEGEIVFLQFAALYHYLIHGQQAGDEVE